MISAQYIAGLIDGEGYLAMLPSRAKGLKNQSFEAVIKIGMTGDTAKEIFVQLQSQYGGIVESNQVSTMGRQVYTYVLKSRAKVLPLLNDITPYLIVKKDQALLLAEYCTLPMTHTRHTSYDPSVLERKIQIFTELKRLKQPPATTN